HVRRPKVKLRPVPREKRRVPPPLFLRQDVHFRHELRVRLDRPRLRQHHPPLHVLPLHSPQQHPNVVPPPPPPHHPPEHPHPRPPLVLPPPHLRLLPHRLQRPQCRPPDHRNLLPRKFIRVQ